VRCDRLVALALAIVPGAAAAQAFRIEPAAQPELRVGVVAARESMALAGVAVNIPANYYVRVAASAEIGTLLTKEGGAAARAELVGRFLADPFRQSRWGAYGGGGVVGVWSEGSRGRGALMLVAGVDLPGAVGWKPALEIAGGGGVRVSIALKPVRRIGR
jgi:hypothetical protein